MPPRPTCRPVSSEFGAVRHRVPWLSEKQQETISHGSEIRWCPRKLVPFQIDTPLPGTIGIVIELRRQSDWQSLGDCGTAFFESCAYGAYEVIALEGEVLCKRVKIVKIFIATVPFANHNHRVELLGHDGFAWVNTNLRTRGVVINLARTAAPTFRRSLRVTTRAPLGRAA